MIEVVNLKNADTRPVAFSVNAGEIVGLLGESGIGKTAICDMLTGFIPYSGNISVDELEVSLFPVQCKSKIGYMPQENPLYPEMTVSEFLNFVAGIKKADAASVSDISERLELGTISNKLICCLSKDDCKKLSLAAALINNPQTLVLDEPVSGVSCEAKAFILNIIKEFASEKAVLIASTKSLEIFDRVIDLNNEKMFDQLDESFEDELLDNEELEASLDEELLEDVTEVNDAYDEEEETQENNEEEIQ